MLCNHDSITTIKVDKARGFTLIELMISVAIMGLLAMVAYPSYSDYVVRSNRAEASRELVRLASLQEQVFVDSRAYTEDMKNLGSTATASYKTQSGNYLISSKVIGNTFTLTANAQGTQKAKDTACVAMTITDTGKKLPNICWEQ